MRFVGQTFTYVFAISLCGGLSGLLAYGIFYNFDSIQHQTKLYIAFIAILIGGICGLRWARKPEKFWGEFISGIIDNIFHIF